MTILRLQQKLARALLTFGVSGEISDDGLTITVDDATQLEAAREALAKFFPDMAHTLTCTTTETRP